MQEIEAAGPEAPNTLQVTWNDQSPAQLLVLTGEWLEHQNALLSLQYYEAALQIEPDLAIAAWRYGHLALKQNLAEQGREKLESALSHFSKSAPMHYCLSLLYEELNDDAASLRYADQALSINPLHSGAFLQKARLLAKRCDWEALQECLAHNIPNLENAGEMLLYRVLTLIHTGQKAEARTLYNQIGRRHRHRFAALA
jgi:tetratricopeptide (TPR) repeat protein